MDADKKRIWIRGQYVEVTDEVYRAYMQGDRKMRYFENDLKTERFVLGKEGQVVQIIPSREDSLDRLVDENAQQFSDEQEMLMYRPLLLKEAILDSNLDEDLYQELCLVFLRCIEKFRL